MCLPIQRVLVKSRKKYKAAKSSTFAKIRVFLLFLLVLNAVLGYLLWEFLQDNKDGTETSVTQMVDDSGSGVDKGADAPEKVDGKPGDEPGETASFNEQVAGEKDNVRSGVIGSGDTASTLLQEWLPLSDVNAMDEASKSLFPLRRLREGQPYSVYVNEEGLERFEYEIDDSDKLILTRDADSPSHFSARIEKIPYEVLLERIEGVIDSSLFQSVADLGESPILAVRLADIFAWEVNFIKDIRQGDQFTLVVEKNFREGEFKRYGKVLAANFVNQGKKHEAFLFRSDDGSPYYFTESGESLKRAFLQAPLSFTRISSGFTPKRFHPILKEWRSHPAIDYAAPSGTPVKAVGNAVVNYAGWGTGAGNYISLKHSNGYETMYLHLSGFARGLKKGNKVSQGEVIGFVGSTGYSTGPHLDFRMKKDGSFVNPMSALNPRADSMDKKSLPEFKKRAAYYKEFLNGNKSLTGYIPFEELKQ